MGLGKNTSPLRYSMSWTVASSIRIAAFSSSRIERNDVSLPFDRWLSSHTTQSPTSSQVPCWKKHRIYGQGELESQGSLATLQRTLRTRIQVFWNRKAKSTYEAHSSQIGCVCFIYFLYAFLLIAFSTSSAYESLT